MYAAGLTLKPENVPAFTQRFERFVEDHITPEQMIPTIDVDAEIPLSKINDSFYNILKQFQPYGPGNMKPVFASCRVYDYGTSRVVGKTDGECKPRHLKVELIENNTPCRKTGIGFSMEDKLPLLIDSEPVDVCYTIEENHFNGSVTLQMQVRDIKKSQ